ncbi:zinc-binding dehydrogenase, partial [Kitasatospora aureofaciens]|uniref:zinc-binding dehydrogenase n=1 Tax=Kitasatospora aureofaciens TaxID=1894 RepID=UPI00131E2AF6
AMAVNETVLAFVLGGSAPGAAGGVGTVRSWSTETEFLLPGGRRKVRPDGVWQAPEIGVPVLMVEVDRVTMAPADVAAKFPRYRELFRTRVRDNDPALADREPADRTVHWWRRTWPGHTRAGYPPVALVVTDAGPVALANRQEAVGELSAECWRGRWCREVRDDNDDGWREYDDAVPIVATTLELLAAAYVAVGVVGGQPPADFGMRLMDAFRRSLSFATFSSDTVTGPDRQAVRSSQFADAAHGDLHTVVHEVLPLDQAVRAHRAMDAGEVFGRVVLAP